MGLSDQEVDLARFDDLEPRARARAGWSDGDAERAADLGASERAIPALRAMCREEPPPDRQNSGGFARLNRQRVATSDT